MQGNKLCVFVCVCVSLDGICEEVTDVEDGALDPTDRRKHPGSSQVA